MQGSIVSLCISTMKLLNGNFFQKWLFVLFFVTPPEKCKDPCFSLSFPTSGGYLHSLARGPSLHLQIQHCSIFRSDSAIPAFPYKDSSDYIGPTQIIQNNVTISKCLSSSHMQSSLLPRKVIYSQLSGIRMWTFWGVDYSACCRRPINNLPQDK